MPLQTLVFKRFIESSFPPGCRKTKRADLPAKMAPIYKNAKKNVFKIVNFLIFKLKTKITKTNFFFKTP